MNRIAVLLMAILAVTTIRPALADPLEATLAKFGLLGVWAVDCGAAPSTENPYALYRALSPHEAEVQYDFGPRFELQTRVITFAESVGGNRLRLRHIDRQDGISREVVIQRLGDRIQNFSVVQGDGKVIVKNGIYAVNGRPAVWLEQCR